MNSDQYKVPELQMSGVVGVRSGVEDKSAATKMSGYARALDSTQQQAFSLYEDHKKSEAAQASNSSSEAYKQALETELVMKEQGVSPEKIAAFRIKSDKEAAGGLSAADRMNMRKKFEGLSYASALTEKSPEEKRAEAVENAGLSLGLDPADEDFYDKSEEIYLAQTQDRVTGSQLATAGLASVEGRARTIVNDQSLPEGEKMARLARLKMETIAEIQERLAHSDDPDIAKGLIATYSSYIDVFSQEASSTTIVTRAENEDKLKSLAEVNRAVAAMSPEAQQYSTLSKVFGQNAPLFLTRHMDTLSAEALGVGKTKEKAVQEGVKGMESLSEGTFTVSSPNAASTYGLLQEAITSGATGETPVEDIQPSVDKVVDSSIRDFKTLTNTEDAEELIKFLSSPEARENFSPYYDNLTPEAKEGLKLSFTQHLSDVLGPKVQTLIDETVSKKGRRRNTETTAASSPQNLKDIDLELVGDTVQFYSERGDLQEVVAQLNQDASSDITAYFGALGTATNMSIKDALELGKDVVLPKPTEQEALYSQSAGKLGEQAGTFTVDQRGIEQGLPIQSDEAGIVSEKELSEVTMKQTGNEEYDNEIRGLVESLDKVQDPSLRYVLKKQLKSLNDRAGIVTAGDSRKERQRGPKSPSEDTAEIASSAEPSQVPKAEKSFEVIQQTVMQDEGYFEGSKVVGNLRGNGSFNVPESGKSGLTIAGVDLGQITKGATFDLLMGTMTPEQQDIVKQAVGKNRANEGQDYLEAVAKDLEDSGYKLNNSQIKEVQKQAVQEVVKKFERASKLKLEEVPKPIREVLIPQLLNEFGPDSVEKLSKAINSRKLKDWEAAYGEFNNYRWKKGTSQSNIDRTDKVAEAIEDYIDAIY